MTDFFSPGNPEPFKPGTARRRLAENLRLVRLLRNWSQEDLADTAGLDRSFIGGIERAERSVGLDNLEKIAHAVGMSISDLITEPDPQLIADKILEVVRSAVDAQRRVREEPAFYLAS